MGGVPYYYVVPISGDVQATLNALREREFRAGRYNPVMDDIRFPITAKSPAPGAKHKTMELALKASREDGTRSILDILEIADQPTYHAACLLPAETLKRIYGTDRPDRSIIDNDRYMRKLFMGHRIERGHAIYFLIYEDGQPVEVFFAGYSFD